MCISKCIILNTEVVSKISKFGFVGVPFNPNSIGGGRGKSTPCGAKFSESARVRTKITLL